MFRWLCNWWNGELIEVEILECRRSLNHFCIDHTVVACPDGTRKYVSGHRGVKGEKIKVNTWELGTLV